MQKEETKKLDNDISIVNDNIAVLQSFDEEDFKNGNIQGTAEHAFDRGKYDPKIKHGIGTISHEVTNLEYFHKNKLLGCSHMKLEIEEDLEIRSSKQGPVDLFSKKCNPPELLVKGDFRESHLGGTWSQRVRRNVKTENAASREYGQDHAYDP